MPDAETFVGESVEIALVRYFSDPDGDDLAYSTISSNAGVVTVTVADADLRVTGVGQGAAVVTVTVTDPYGLSATQVFVVTVPNRAPGAVGQMPDADTFVGESVEIALEGVLQRARWRPAVLLGDLVQRWRRHGHRFGCRSPGHRGRTGHRDGDRYRNGPGHPLGDADIRG